MHVFMHFFIKSSYATLIYFFASSSIKRSSYQLQYMEICLIALLMFGVVLLFLMMGVPVAFAFGTVSIAFAFFIPEVGFEEYRGLK